VLKLISLYIMAALYIGAGALHFIRPAMYVKIVPPYLPAPLVLVYVSGAAEILIGILLYVPAVRPWAAWGAIALLIAVFPANLYMYQQGGAQFGMPDWFLLARLPLQLVLIGWAYLYT
jgi:uncharacterized membrane protein